MTLTEPLTQLPAPPPEDWSTIGCWGAGSGPSYRDHLTFWNTYDVDQKNVLTVDSHSNVGVFNPNLAITIAWGMKSSEVYGDYDAGWLSGTGQAGFKFLPGHLL